MKNYLFPLLFTAFIAISSCTNKTGKSPADDKSLKNPVIPGYYADPTMVIHEGKYYIFVTIDPWGGSELALWESENFKDWTFHRLNWPTKEQCTTPTSTRNLVWAPCVIKALNGKYYMYVSVGSEVYVGVADHPVGPWKNALGGDKPLIYNKGESEAIHNIDAECFIDDDGQAYLYWGSGWNWMNGRCHVVKLNPDMVTMESEPVDITPAHYFEAPFMLKYGGNYFLMYSEGKCINHTYMVHYSTADSPLGRWELGYNSPVLSSNEDTSISGPGHHAVYTHENQYYILYHRIFKPQLKLRSLYRQICIDSLNFNEEGKMLTVNPSQTGVADFLNKQKTVNMAVNKSVKASSELNENYPAEGAVDDNYGSLWVAGENDSIASLTLDLGEIMEIAACRIYFEYAIKPYTYKIDYSTDGENWELYADKSDNMEIASPYIDTNTVNAEFIKV